MTGRSCPNQGIDCIGHPIQDTPCMTSCLVMHPTHEERSRDLVSTISTFYLFFCYPPRHGRKRYFRRGEAPEPFDRLQKRFRGCTLMKKLPVPRSNGEEWVRKRLESAEGPSIICSQWIAHGFGRRWRGRLDT